MKQRNVKTKKNDLKKKKLNLWEGKTVCNGDSIARKKWAKIKPIYSNQEVSASY